jgi:hypothetical protein
MTIKKQQFTRGITLRPDDVAMDGIAGELKVALTAQRLQVYLNAAVREVVTADQSQTLTNKTIDADLNTISNIDNADIKSAAGIVESKLALDFSTASLNTTITDHIVDAIDAHDASAISNVPAGSISSTDVQAALNELDTDIQNHINDTSDAHDASAISVAAISGLTATDVQAAFAEHQTEIEDAQADAAQALSNSSSAQTDVNNHIADTSDAHDASAISNVPAGNLAATDVQGALNELQTDIDSRALTSDLTTHTGASTDVHGLTGGAAVVGTTSTQTLTNKTLTSPVLNTPSVVTPSRLDVKQDTKANLDVYADTASAGQLVYATDQEKFFGVIDSDLKPLGGGSQGLDTFVQLYADEQTTDWSTGNNATFLGGGSLAGTFTRVTSGQLNGDASYRFTQAAGSLNDYIASPIQAVPVRFRGQTVTITKFYNYDGNNSDISLVVWDVTNSTKITTDSQNALVTTSGSVYKANITIPITCTQIRVGFQVKVANNGKILNFDDIEISADTTKYTDPSTVTDWQSYTPTFTGFGTAASVEFQWRRVGADVEIRGKFTSGTPTATEARITLPNSYTSAGTAVIPSIQISGLVGRSDNSAATYVALIEPSVAYITFGNQQAAGGTQAKINGSTMANAASTISVIAKVPVFGLSASNPQIITAPESCCKDTALFQYAGSGVYTLSTLANAPVGTFITFTYAANTNSRTQTTTAPTQTTSSMNINGIQIFTRAFNSGSTAASPTAFAIQIGRGLKGRTLDFYKSTGKTIPGDFDLVQNSTELYGVTHKSYDELTGILYLDAGLSINAADASRLFRFTDNNVQSNGYFVINASKSPTLVGVPQVQPRFATVSHQLASGTSGGTFTSGSYQTRPLNTIVDSTSIVTSLTSNQFTLPAGTYYLDAYAQAKDVNTHKLKIRNITDSTDALIGVATVSNATAGALDAALVCGEVTITASKAFELQHRCQTTKATDGFGAAASYGDNEVYAVVKITKVK